MSGKLEGNRKLIAFFGGFIGLMYAQSSGIIQTDEVQELLQWLFGLFFGANVVGDHGKEVLHKYLEVMVKRIEAGK